MLHYQSVDPRTLDLLKGLMSLPCLETANLVGGTALALHFGHRMSIDLDLFSESPLDYAKVLNSISGEIRIDHHNEKFLGIYVDGIKVDILNYDVPLIYPLIEIDGLRLLDPRDIGAMKLLAITKRGVKKDFWDLYFLLRHYSAQELLDFFERKFPRINKFMVLKSVNYFTDADSLPDPVKILNADWEEIKSGIEKAFYELL